MSFASPAYLIPRESVVGEEHEWAKMFDPPTASPVTPELLSPTNPVPEVMLAAGFQNKVTPPTPSNGTCSTGLSLTSWDNRPNGLRFFTFADQDNPSATGTYPGPTLRVPRGAIFHGATSAKGPPPHTIHWHGTSPPPSTTGWDTAPWSWGLTPTSSSPTSSAPIFTTAIEIPCSISNSGSSA